MTASYSIVCSDGALRAGYIVGFLMELYSQDPELWECCDAFTASSASVGNMFYYLSYGYDHPGKVMWTRELASPKFFSMFNFLHGSKLYDLDFMINEIFRKKYPLSFEAIDTTDKLFYFPLLSYEDRSVHVYTNDQDLIDNSVYFSFKGVDKYDLIKAANAAPLIYDQIVDVCGRKYFDAGMASPYLVHVPKVMNGKALIVSTQYDLPKVDQFFYRLVGNGAAMFPRLFGGKLEPWIYKLVSRKPDVYSSLGKLVGSKVASGDWLLSSPSRRLSGSFNNSHRALERNFGIGVQDCRRLLPEIRKLVGS